MPLYSVGRRLLQLTAGRPVRVKHHLYANPLGHLGGAQQLDLHDSLDQQRKETHESAAASTASALRRQHCSTDRHPAGSRSCSTAAVAAEEDTRHVIVEASEGSSNAASCTGGKDENAAKETGNLGSRGGGVADRKTGRSWLPEVEAPKPTNRSQETNGHRKAGRKTVAGARSWLQDEVSPSQSANQMRNDGGKAAPSTDWALVQKAMKRAGATQPQSERGRPHDPAVGQLWTLCQEGRAGEAEQQLRERLETRGALSIKEFNYLLKACATGEHVELGLHVYATMREWGVPPDVRSVGWMLRLYVRAGQVDQALSWLAAERLQLRSLVSQETGAALSPAYFLNVLLEECITRRDWAAAGRCADQLGESGMDDLTYRLLLQIGGLERRPQSVALTWAALQETGGRRTAAQHSSYIQALARCDQVHEAVRELRALGNSIQRAESIGQRRNAREAGTASHWGQGQESAGQDGGSRLRTGDRPRGASVQGRGGAGKDGESRATMTSTERKAGLGDVSERGPESAALPKGGEKEEGLWWAAPPPRGTDKGTLAHLRVAYNAVIAAAARCDDVDMAEELFKEMRRADLLPDRYTYNALLRGIAAARDFEDTQRVFRGMEAGGLLPDAHTLAAVVGAHLKAGQRDQAAQLLADAATAYPAHIPKYTFAFNALLEACAQQGDPVRALRVFRQMKAHSVVPDACTYLALFQAFQPAAPSAEEGADSLGVANKAAQEQLLALEEDMRASGVQHTPQTYTALVVALGPAGMPLLRRRVLQAKQAAQQGGTVPLDVGFFNAAISVCAAARQLRPALWLHAEMAAVGVAADVETYNVLINCCAVTHDVREGLRLAGRALQEGHLADSYTINTLIKLCCSRSQYQAALQLLFRAEAAGARSDLVGYNLLVGAAARGGNLATMERLLERMKRRGILPDGNTCLEVVQAYVEQGYPNEAAEALDALTARMFGHGGASGPLAIEGGGAGPLVKEEWISGQSEDRAEGAAGYKEWPQTAEGRQSRAGEGQRVARRLLHVESKGEDAVTKEEDWEFVGDWLDQGGGLAEEENAVTAEIMRQAMLFPTLEARKEFLARMVGVSGGGFEGPPEAWEQRVAMLAEVDWNSWAYRLRKEYDARKVSRLRDSKAPEDAGE